MSNVDYHLAHWLPSSLLNSPKRCFWCFYFIILPIFRKSRISYPITDFDDSDLSIKKSVVKKFNFIRTKKVIKGKSALKGNKQTKNF